MIVVGVHNIKGGVGKTATAVNLAYFAARSGMRTLVWDLDPQAAASFYFRVKPKLRGGARGLIGREHDPGDSIKATDFPNLDLLPAERSVRKLDLLLDAADKPGRQLRKVLKPLRRDYDLLLLDCAPGISPAVESVLGAVDVLLMPTIPTILSLRTLEQMARFCADRELEQARRMAFFSMVDRRKRMHRAIVERPPNGLAEFLGADIPYASDVERMGEARAPVAAFAPSSRAAQAYSTLWAALSGRLQAPGGKHG